MIARLFVCLAGSVILAVGLGWTWGLYFPSTQTNNILFGGMLIPVACVACIPLLWFGSWRQRWLRLVPAALLLWGAIGWAYYHG